MLSQLPTTPRFQLILVTLFAAVLFFSKLGGNGIANWDDCYYAQKAKEILATGDWLTMHYDGMPEVDNPPFFMWLVALSFLAFGVSEYAAIFPSALMGVATVALVWVFARRLYTPWAGTFAAFVLATTAPFLKYGRHAMMDVTLSFFVTLALLSLYLAVHENRRPYFLLWGACIAVAILIKSVLGFFPLVVSGAYLTASKRWRVFGDGWFIGGASLALALGCAWYAHQYAKFGQWFLERHFGWLIVQRGFARDPEPWHAHLSYLRDLARYYWPWLPLLTFGLVHGAARAWKGDHRALLLVLWLMIITVVMSLTQSRMLWYIMPIFPAAAMICGALLDSWLSEPVKARAVRYGAVLTVLVAAVVQFTPIQLSAEREIDARVLAPYVRHFASSGAPVYGYRFETHEVNNALLFYSDHAAYPIHATTEELSSAFAEPSLALCVLHSADLDSVVRAMPSVHVVRRVERLALISNASVDTSGIVTWKEMSRRP
jgi:4-amino-4-deoxy-L-arabinose transferase-like glycosyltransferase